MRRPRTGGPWGLGLLLLGTGLIIRGLGYVTSTPADLAIPLAWLNQNDWFPVAGLGWLWVGVGVWSVYRALTPPQRYLDLMPALSLMTLWASLYLLYWAGFGILEGRWTREWQGGVNYLLIAAILASWGWCVNPPRGRPRRVP
jgi:hypothetical protein